MSPLTLPSAFCHCLKLVYFLISIYKTRKGKLRQKNLINHFGALFDLAAVRLHGVSMQKRPFNHSTYHVLGKGHTLWIKILISIKPVWHGLCAKHFSCFIWDVLVGIYRGSQTVFLLRGNRLHRAFYPAHKAVGNNLWCAWIMHSLLWLFHSEMWVLDQSKHTLPLCSLQSQRHSPHINPSRAISVQVFQEADDTNPENERTAHSTSWFQ